MATTHNNGVKTTRTSFAIIEFLHSEGEATVEDIENELNLTNSTVHRHLSTLRELGYIRKEGATYKLSFQFLTIGGGLQRRITGYPILKRKVDELANQTNERVQFIVREETERVYVYTNAGDRTVQTGASIGRRGPIHASAAGKAILAHLPRSEREQVIANLSFNETGPNTITDEDALRKDLRQLREQGYSINLQESTHGVHAVGVVIEGREGKVIGALSISGCATRIKDQRLKEEFPDLLLQAKNEIELQIEHSDLNLN